MFVYVSTLYKGSKCSLVGLLQGYNSARLQGLELKVVPKTSRVCLLFDCEGPLFKTLFQTFAFFRHFAAIPNTSRGCLRFDPLRRVQIPEASVTKSAFRSKFLFQTCFSVLTRYQSCFLIRAPPTDLKTTVFFGSGPLFDRRPLYKTSPPTSTRPNASRYFILFDSSIILLHRPTYLKTFVFPGSRLLFDRLCMHKTPFRPIPRLIFDPSTIQCRPTDFKTAVFLEPGTLFDRILLCNTFLADLTVSHGKTVYNTPGLPSTNKLS